MLLASLVKQAAGHGKTEAGQARIPKTSDDSLISAIFPAYPCLVCSVSFSKIKVWVADKFEGHFAQLLPDTICRTTLIFIYLRCDIERIIAV